MKCHVQLNQAWMNFFQNAKKDGKQTYCMSLPSLEITSQKTRDLDTIDDFYVQDIEEFYNKYEMSFGEVLHKIHKGINSSTTSFYLSQEEKNFIQRFMAINVSRSLTVNSVIDSTPDLSAPPGVFSVAVHNGESKYFEEYKLRFIFNSSQIGFVLPSFCYYRTSKNVAVVPVSNKVAIVFDKNDCVEYSVINISDEDVITNEYNYCAYVVEAGTNCQFLIAKTSKTLLALKDKINMRK